MKFLVRVLLTCWLALGLLAGPAYAALTIEITQGAQGALPIAIVPFGWQGPAPNPPQDVASIISSDLYRSGRFAPVPAKNMPEQPHDGNQVNFASWRAVGTPNLVVGQIRPTGQGMYVVQFQLFDVYQGTQLTGYSITAPASELRHVAHHISDIIYEKLTGQRGAFNTRIAYVIAKGSRSSKSYQVVVSDWDGYDPQIIVRSKQPLMGPAWSPHGRRLAYVSFELGHAQVYVQTVATGARLRLAQYPEIGGAQVWSPVWSPDGRQLALTISRNGNPDIYIFNLASKTLRRITHSGAIDTEPTWSPDGRTLVFTSDRGGSPQLYKVSVNGGRPQRITFQGNYNARADFSPDGRQIAFVHRVSGKFQIAVLDLDSGQMRVLTDDDLDDSPSFAPNGSMILYASRHGGRGVLAEVSDDGSVHQRLTSQQGSLQEPSWGPYAQR